MSMNRHLIRITRIAMAILIASLAGHAATITSGGQPAQLDIRAGGDHSIRITLRPLSYTETFPYTPALVERSWPAPAISLRSIDKAVSKRVGGLQVRVKGDPQLTIEISNAAGQAIQTLVFDSASGKLSFQLDSMPVLGMGEGGPQMGQGWEKGEGTLQFDRRGALDPMIPRWQSQVYGSRNPVALLVGTAGWGLFVATPWVEVDLTDKARGVFVPWQRPADTSGRGGVALVQGRPPAGIPQGVFDVFVFDAHRPDVFMKEVSMLTGPAVMPPKWALGYMQSHRTLMDETQMIDIVQTFRDKKIPVDAVIYLGTGFCPRGWNTEQPSFDFNPEVFKRNPKDVIADLHARNVKVVTHIVPWQRDKLPTIQGTIPPRQGETLDVSHIQNYWQQHVKLLEAGMDAFWPDEGDWFNLFERVKRHQLYYQGPLSTRPNVRPWSLHRNGYLGISQWGGWVWSGDTDSSWRTLEAQVMVGINHSLSISPYWGSDTGGFYPNAELTGELYARWFQFSSFTPSFRSHGRTWWTRLPWGWGLSEMGPNENGRNNPNASELNNPAIEPICREYGNLRYQLLPYTYTLARAAHDTGMPLMRAMWLHYPDDPKAVADGSQYLWGRDMLVAPVFKQGARSREVYLPKGDWYDWWTNEKQAGGKTITRMVDLKTMPLYIRAGAILPVDPVRQYTDEKVAEPTTLKVYRGANGQFTLYEDDGISLDYLLNKASWTRLNWNDGARRLTIEPGAPAGAPAVRASRSFKVQLLPEGTTKTVEYKGQKVEVVF